MGVYILKRLFLIVPTLFGIMVINFLIVQTAPGGPVEQIIAQLTGEDTNATARITGGGGGDLGDASGMSDTSVNSAYEGARGLDQARPQRGQRRGVRSIFGFVCSSALFGVNCLASRIMEPNVPQMFQ